MSDNSSSFETKSLGETDSEPQWAGFGPRFVAYLLDVVPITLAIAAFYYVFLGFDETWQRHFSAPGDTDAKIAFLIQRNQIRDLSLTVYILYCALIEGTAMQGTLGKRLVGIRVTDNNGHQLTAGRSFGRNLAKFISYIPLCLGFFWAVWSKKKRGWHDIIAKTLVVKSNTH